MALGGEYYWPSTLLKEADIVVTNPPFSLFREYVAQLVEFNKKFLIVGTWNVITYKDIFQLIMNNKIWIGINSNRNFSGFIVPKHYSLYGSEARLDENGNRIVSTNNTCWFTNLDISKRHEELILYKPFNRKEYPKYDNYDAIEVSNTKDIPVDYDGCMGVPITFLNKYNPDQFEILGCSYSYGEPVGYHKKGTDFSVSIKGEQKYKRLFIKNKRILNK